MIVAGGCYRELCESPHWDSLLGSGGRAAVALVSLASGIELHTYFPAELRHLLHHIEALGVRVHATPSRSEIVFAYFHPLATPTIAPPLTDLPHHAPLKVSGRVALRFGFVEGDVVVDAERVVYDPQNPNSAPFRKNGSKAKALALVMNQRELFAAASTSDLREAAQRILAQDSAEVVVVKCGVNGAWVVSRVADPTWIPAYWSSTVFKIGSGDVFSAAFAHYWGSEVRDATEAADLASRCVAHYVQSRSLPLQPQVTSTKATGRAKSVIRLIGTDRSLGGRWLCEEAFWQLSEFGLEIIRDTDARAALQQMDKNEVALVIADSLPDRGASAIKEAISIGMPVVFFHEIAPALALPPTSRVRATSDFTTALYWTAWTSAEG